jgi:phosphatidylethanolamine-binding protein (PEBP) family uncharacterized protein
MTLTLTSPALVVEDPDAPRGHGVHQYHFRLAALDVPRLGVAGRAGVGEVWEEARRHAMETAELVGTFRRDGR